METKQSASSREVQYPAELSNAQTRRQHSMLRDNPECLYSNYTNTGGKKIKNNLIFQLNTPKPGTLLYVASTEALKEEGSAIKKSKAEVALLIDSNGKYLATWRLFPGCQVNKIRCVNTKRAQQLLDLHTLGSPAYIVIHTGTSDQGSLCQHTGRAMKRVAERASLEFPDSRVVISTLLP
ncbi:hypothetical protein EOD39_14522 [Acipenser ruthenus]|uniref:Uncharacterized protein n=1 Tax=Acipenser ruthenus TaxID=7906 RepID=A0A662YKV1_ACIRT|nr:hypothetical protein EOD39_14522 [Acipenser ruthenus]